MNDYGTLQRSGDRYTIKFERCFSHSPEEVFFVITNANSFSQWYPFATGEMELRLGGEISFDDGEGMTYTGIITKLEQPYLFGFREVDDLIHISLEEEDQGCRMVFTHTFNDHSWAVSTAAGWHRCLDVLEQIVSSKPLKWADNAVELREIYSKAFGMDSHQSSPD